MIAKAEFAHGDFDTVLKDLSDVQSWPGRIDIRADGWLIVCDTYIMRKQWNDALECIHHLDASGLMPDRRDEIASRERNIADNRNAEVKLQEIQDLERGMKLPIDTFIPVLPSSGSDSLVPGPALPPTITNPIVNPLKHLDPAH